jgi:hypothetical protein
VVEKNLRPVEYKDLDGRLSLRLVPLDAPDSEAAVGIVVGPPPLDALELPEKLAIRLQNEFFHRGLFTEQDIKRRRNDAVAAIMAACRLDIETLLASLNRGG